MSANTFTPNLGLPIISNDTKGGVYEFNRTLLIATENTYLRVLARNLTDPPASPSEGDAYYVASNGGGAWDGHNDEIAYYYNGWRFINPRIGMILWDEATDTRWIFTENGWIGGVTIADIGGSDTLEQLQNNLLDPLILELRRHGLIQP